MLIYISFCLLTYCVGSISSAVILCKMAGLPDPRSAGSKNPGATNVLRLGSKKVAIATLLCDALKGAIPVTIALKINPQPELVGFVIIAVFLGHLYPVFFRFQGGKGVATALGAIFALSWPMGLVLVSTWIVVVFLTRYSSLGSLVTALFAPFYTVLFTNPKYAFAVLVVTAFLWWRHRGNIQRLLQRTEPKLGEKNQASNDNCSSLGS
jgi:glycerol-3-phosphate acyltransferase PlsY